VCVLQVKLSCVLTTAEENANNKHLMEYLSTARACGVKRVAIRKLFGCAGSDVDDVGELLVCGDHGCVCDDDGEREFLLVSFCRLPVCN